MKTLTNEELSRVAGRYFAPENLYQYTKALPFLGKVQCNVDSLTAGQWAEVVVTYEVGGSGLADGAWIKGTFQVLFGKEVASHGILGLTKNQKLKGGPVNANIRTGLSFKRQIQRQIITSRSSISPVAAPGPNPCNQCGHLQCASIKRATKDPIRKRSSWILWMGT